MDKIIEEIYECIEYADFSSLENKTEQLLKRNSIDEVSKQISQIIGNTYTQHKSDYLAKILEVILRINKNIALINHPTNYLFQTIISTGSYEIYECFIEEAVLPNLSNIDVDDHEMYYMDLLNIAQILTDKLFEENKKCIKGVHYNGAFSKYEQNENIVLVNEQDYIIMEDVLERYNSIVGRSQIIKDLSQRCGL